MRSPARWHPTPQAGAGSSSGRPARVDPREVANRLVPAVHWPGALDTEQRTWRLVARTTDFDAWLIAWPSGGKVDLHDHGSSIGAVSVISGALVEAVPCRDLTGRLSLVHHELRTGATVDFGAGHVHDVTNGSDRHALSLHVYSPALTSMTFYDMREDQLVVRGVEWAADGCGEVEQHWAARAGGAQSAAR